MDWLDTQFIYTVTTNILDGGLERLFDGVNNALSAFWTPIQVSAAIYIALLGYGLVSGMISLSAREVAVRLLKVIGIILLVRLIFGFGDTLFTEFWKFPNAIADYFAQLVSPILGAVNISGIPGFSTSSPDTLDGLARTYTGLASFLGNRVMDEHNDSLKWGLGAWGAAMIPFIITIVAIYVAKFVSAMLFLATPIVFILSLTLGSVKGNQILATWFKALAMTIVSVIFVYIVGIACMAMIARYMAAMIVTDLAITVGSSIPVIGSFFEGTNKYTIVHLTPMAIIGVLSIVLVSQATSVAGSLLSVAGINTQQATSFMQIGALQAAGQVK